MARPRRQNERVNIYFHHVLSTWPSHPNNPCCVCVTCSFCVDRENKKEIWNYKQCPSLVPLINNIRNNRSLNTAQKLVAFKALRSDKKTCPSKIRHPPNGLEYGLGCSMCADNDNDEANAEASLRAREEKKEKLFTHSRDMDTNGTVLHHCHNLMKYISSSFTYCIITGVLYFLGTKRNTARWINPVDLGVVKVMLNSP